MVLALVALKALATHVPALHRPPLSRVRLSFVDYFGHLPGGLNCGLGRCPLDCQVKEVGDSRYVFPIAHFKSLHRLANFFEARTELEPVLRITNYGSEHLTARVETLQDVEGRELIVIDQEY